jgi:DNA-binding NarL/FixJ family response regulator
VTEGPHNANVPPVERLTGRQKQILDLLCQNMTSHQVGAVLGICARTVDNHCVRICRVLEVADRFEAVRIWSAVGDADESCASWGPRRQGS